MKFLVVLSAVLACTFAKPGVFAPSVYSAPAVAAHLGYAGYAGYAAPAVAAPVAYAAHVAAPAVAAPVAYAAPAVAAHAVVAAPAPVSVHTQYHAQDELGQASYGHAEPFQTHNAIQDAAGNKVGSFSYLSPEGHVFKTDYVADGLGYRVASNALPVGPSAPVVDTPEVVAAKAAHFAAHGAVIHRVRRQIIGHTPAATAPLAHPIAAPVAYAAPYAHVAAPYAHFAAPYAPVAYAGPAVRPGILTNIVNNPGHAVSYRVD
ncbi:cuticle protein 21-like [Periplaneta americana]|uniref:cuticle protein 21-like n=1 Tax=Periplaneta americana TaxID=6978 RepID=UPI0037E765AC